MFCCAFALCVLLCAIIVVVSVPSAVLRNKFLFVRRVQRGRPVTRQSDRFESPAVALRLHSPPEVTRTPRLIRERLRHRVATVKTISVSLFSCLFLYTCIIFTGSVKSDEFCGLIFGSSPSSTLRY